jgi:putative ABC transport system substrate-binding protein
VCSSIAQDRLPGLAAELVALKVDIILAAGAQTMQAVKAASSTIPIVMAAVNDPVARGFVESLAPPGSTVTGLTLASEDVAAKWLMLKEVAPRANCVAVLISRPAIPSATC